MCGIAGFYNLSRSQFKIDEAELLITELYALASEGKRTERLIELTVSYPALYEIKGDHDKADRYCIEAMEMASSENLLSYFVVDIVQIDKILNRVFTSEI